MKPPDETSIDWHSDQARPSATDDDLVASRQESALVRKQEFMLAHRHLSMIDAPLGITQAVRDEGGTT